MKPKKLIIKTVSQKYSILIGSNLIVNISKIMKKNLNDFKKCLFIVDKKVPKKFIFSIKKSFKDKNIFFEYFLMNEKNKNIQTVNKILKILLTKNFSRKDCLITIGGGITGDVGGFTASLFKRGLQFVNIPTTLLSQVDSSVGGKTGVNTKYGKNLIGSFYQPNLVISDINFLKTLPYREIICGYAEILKHALIANKKFFKYLDKNFLKILKLHTPFLENAIYESCKIKKNVVQKDEKEQNFRKILNFGHTFAHAFEATLGYSKKLNHGEAVLLGMYIALNFSYKNKILKNNEYSLIINHFEKSSLPSNIKKKFSKKDVNKILSFMQKDKKNISKKINLILLKNIGLPIINNSYKINYIKSFLKKELNN
tara:strand:- start:309 stop:1415 length:1107 start_codon:yes stop_codon:yes gene_type:complete